MRFTMRSRLSTSLPGLFMASVVGRSSLVVGKLLANDQRLRRLSRRSLLRFRFSYNSPLEDAIHIDARRMD